MFSTAEALLCGTYTPLGQVQIGPLPSLSGQLVAYQIPSGIISTVKLADLAVTSAKLANASVTLLKIANAVITNAKIDPAAAIVESKLSLIYGTQALHDDIATRVLAATYLAHNHSIADPTQVDHANLINVLTSQHHVRYADSEAVDAVEAVSTTLTLAGNLFINKQIIRINSIGNANFIANAALGTDGAYSMLENGVSKAIFFYDSNLNRFDIYNYTSAEYLHMKNSGGGEYTGNFKFLGNVTLVAGKAISSAGAINLKPSGDTDDYLEFSTVSDAPIITIKGGHYYQLKSDNAGSVMQRIQEDGTKYLELKWDKTAVMASIASSHALRLIASGAFSNYIQLSTVAAVPKMDAIGANKIQIDGVDVSAHAANSDAHHIEAHNLSTHGDVSATGAQLEALLMFESGNAAWFPCPFEISFQYTGLDVHATIDYNLTSVHLTNKLTSDGYWQYIVPLSTNKEEGLSLHIKANGLRFYVHDADVNNYVDEVVLLGIKTDGVVTVIRNDPTNHTTVGMKSITGLAETDLGEYSAIYIRIRSEIDTVASFDISQIAVNMFYA